MAEAASGDPAPEGETARARARAPFREGARHAADNHWQRALTAFELALSIYPHARTWFNIAYCERSLGRSVRAWRAFHLALTRDRAHGELSGQERERAQRFVAEIEATLARVTISLPDRGATVAVDGAAIARAPVGTALWLAGADASGADAVPRRFEILLSPGDHELTATHDDGDARLPLAVQVGSNPSLAVLRWTQKPAPVESTPPAPAPRASYDPWRLGFAVGLGAVAAGGILAGSVLTARAASTWNEAEAACPGRVACPDDRGADLSARARREANGATVAFVGAGVASVGALLLGLLSVDTPREAHREGPHFWVGAGTAELRWMWR